MTDASGRMAERLAALAGRQRWWPLVEATPRWIRVRLADELIADSRSALLHVQYGSSDLPRSFLPTYYLPSEAVTPGVLVDSADDGTGLTVWAVQAGGQRVDEGAWMHTDPPEPLQALAGLVTFAWQEPLTWFEEDEPLLRHARDPHKRVDVVPSSRTVRVESDGVVLAESKRPLVLFETALPARYYLPPDDVLVDLTPSTTRSICPYKGVARWWSARVGHRVIDDVAWSYPSPVPENPRIAGLICFRNETVDLIVDDERLERPNTPWS